ncbi:hypothetical protein [Candidatus Electronema sp. JM]|uniref:hypothetical protein n=1 Tax=Candidatus Electronema sp. JM TaxID=3401571 RepID=UPI003AA860C7
MDSMPLMTADVRRSSRASAAREIATKAVMLSRKGSIAASNSIFLLSEETGGFLCLTVKKQRTADQHDG